MITFVTNSEQDAITVAIEQSSGNKWRGVFREPGGLFHVHDVYPLQSAGDRIAIVRNGAIVERRMIS